MGLRPVADDLLIRLTGCPTATFRRGQWETIERIVGGRGRALVVQRTGWGKSAVYFLATRLLRDRGSGPTVLISPLLALMRNQLQMAERLGITARRIDSTNTLEWSDTTDALQAGALDLLLISPERLGNRQFRQEVLPELGAQVGLLVIDEAHCISDWGHDFRPDYRRIGRVLGLLPSSVPVLCTTATANDRVMNDIADQLGDLDIVRGPLDRPSLHLAVMEMPSQARRLAWLASTIPQLTGSGIVYCLTVDDTERVASWLRTQGIDALPYSGQADHDHRVACEEALLRNDAKVVVATSALGMGFDKPDLSFVIHFQSPGNPIAYYQQVGRSGRALKHADGILLRGHEDTNIQDYFIKVAFPPKATAQRIVSLLEQTAEPLSMRHIEEDVNVRHSQLETMLKILEVDGAVERVDGGWRRTLRPWAYDDERVERVTALRRAEQQAMHTYGTTTECRMAFLRRQLDDLPAPACGRCDNCTGKTWGITLDASLVAEANQHLRNRPIEIEPRRRLIATGSCPGGPIPADRQLCPGRSLSRYGDGGWGDMVQRIKYDGLAMPDELVRAAVELIHRWTPDPAPTWVTSVPSSSDPDLVMTLASAVAVDLGLDFRRVVRGSRSRRPQKDMENSAQQLRNVRGAFAIDTGVPAGPVLLIDDIVDSRWTLTTIGIALREAGSGPVHPFVLAKAVSN